MKILFAEDDCVSQTIVASFLRGKGFEVTCAESGDDAWVEFQRDAFRIVITDWRMPGISGLELCRRIREASDGSYTYIIMLTANANNISGLAAGADDYIQKPFDPDELHFRIKAGLRVLELEDRLHHQIELLNGSQASLAETHARLQDELAAASNMQKSLLPKPFPATEPIQFNWSFEPSTDLGGDLFDVQRLADDRFAVMMMDVCGHGVKPALLAVSLHHVLDARNRTTPLLWSDDAIDERNRVVPPSEVLARMNRQFPMDLEQGQYFTMFYGVLEGDTGIFRYSTAGHPTPVLIPQNEGIRPLPGTGVPIGLHVKPDFDSESVALKPGDRLLLFSDGLVESKRKDGERIGTDRLCSWAEEIRGMDVSMMTAALTSHVRDWNEGRPDDDVSILLIEYSGKEAAAKLIAENLLQRKSKTHSWG